MDRDELTLTPTHNSSRLLFGRYCIDREEGILVRGKETDKYMRIADFARVKSIRVDRTTGVESLELEYRRVSTQSIETQWLSSDQLTSQRSEQLIQYGLDITMTNKRQVTEALLASRAHAQVENVFNQFGWGETGDEPVFFHANAIPERGYALSESAKLNVFPKGSLKAWLSMYSAHIQGHTPLELAVVLGCAAPIVSYLESKHTDLKTLFVALNGQSSSGKTTAAMLALSVAGAPSSTNKGLLKSWNATVNSMMSALDGVNGIPICFDELSQSRAVDLTALLYSLAEGKQKDRSTKDGGLRESAHWSTVILSTGELSIFNRLANNLGLRVRILEFSHVQWTRDAAQSENIKSVISKHYGNLLPHFVTRLFEVGLQSIDEEFARQRKLLLEQMPTSDTTRRVSIKLAAIMATAALLVKHTGIEINVDALRAMLLDNDKDNFDDRDHGTKAFDDVLQYLVEHQAKLVRDNQGRIPYEVIGLISTKRSANFENQIIVSILKSHFEPMMTELKYQDSKVVLKDWAKKGLLVTESGRQTVRKNLDVEGIGKKKTPLYSIIVPHEYHHLFVEPPSLMLPSAGTSYSFRPDGFSDEENCIGNPADDIE